jgi:putative DNA primase/helicase
MVDNARGMQRQTRSPSVPADTPTGHPKWKSRPAGIWTYTDASNAPWLIIYRYDTKDDKAFFQYDYKAGKWIEKGGHQLPASRPLYRLGEIAGQQADLIVLVEGEKCADALTRLGIEATTTLGGCGQIRLADFAPLKAWRVSIWADNDEAGGKYAETAAKMLLEAGAAEVLRVPIPEGVPQKWDVADAVRDGWSVEEIRAQIEVAEPITMPEQTAAREERTLTDAEDAPALRELPNINANNEALCEVSSATWNALLDANRPPVVFRVGGLPAWIETDDDGTPIIKPLTQDRMRHRLARVVRWIRIRKEKELPALPPLAVVKDLLAYPDPLLPVLTRIVESPILAPDGSVQTQAGCNPGSRTYYAPAIGFEVPTVALYPSGKDVDRARAFVDEVLCDFPFESEADRAHAVALFLLPFVRELIDGATPLHLIEKPAPGTGASLLADVLLCPSIGRTPATLTEARDEDEWRKRLTAKLAHGPSVILIDNLRRMLDSASLSAMITAGTWEDRLLGTSEMVHVPVRCVWVATGNNPQLSNEIARRSIRIRLDAKVDRPWERETFRHPQLREWAAIHRAELVSAALTLARAWIAAGRPSPSVSLGGFQHWARVVGGILEVATVPGFLTNLDELYEQADAEGAA